MIKAIYFFHRRPDLTVEDFQEYWRTTHADLVRLGHIRMEDILFELGYSKRALMRLRWTRGKWRWSTE
ncbi:MAG: hypothetical protein ISS61_06775 [Desulfobacteraceae bacterium]|nr:hypothetical protein [Desulfobacteraceae bacterium]